MPQDQIFSISEREERRTLPTYSLHLDLIRGSAALTVFVGHVAMIVSGHSETAANGQASGVLIHPANATGLAHSSVVVFFVLSGYLVGGSVVRDLNRHSFSWSRYALRRLARLWTVLVPALLLGAVIDAISLHLFPMTRVVSMGEFSREIQGWPSLTQFLRYLGFLQQIDRLKVPTFGTDWALWSLSNEFWYYVLFPLCAISLIGTRFSKFLRVALAVLTLFLLWFLGSRISGSFPVWLCGVAAYLAPATIPAKYQKAMIAALAVLFGSVVFLMRSIEFGGAKADLLIGISFALVLYAILHRTGPASTSFYSRVAHMISFPSYSLYAVHMPMCVLLAALCEAWIPQIFRHTELTCVIILCLVLAYASIFYTLFERNTDYIRRFCEVSLSKFGRSFSQTRNFR